MDGWMGYDARNTLILAQAAGGGTGLNSKVENRLPRMRRISEGIARKTAQGRIYQCTRYLEKKETKKKLVQKGTECFFFSSKKFFFLFLFQSTKKKKRGLVYYYYYY